MRSIRAFGTGPHRGRHRAGGIDSDMKFARMTADQSVVSSTVLVNLTELVVAIGANETVEFEAVVYYDAVPTGDADIAITVPAASAVQYLGIGLGSTVSGPSTIGNFVNRVRSAGAGVVAVGGIAAGSVVGAIIKGIVVNGANAGTIQVQGAQDTSDATATIFKTNSFLKATRVA